ncbi:MAG: hypothetical protein KDD36_09535 [Flavobacteriales bacterium]|nr:hypothetical protein [Flavobacteriales bacterium]
MALPVFFVLLAFNFASQAQTIEIGVRGTLNSNWLINKNINNQGSEQTYAVSFGHSAGVMAGFLLTDHTELAGEFHLNRTIQRYTGTTSGGVKYESENLLSTYEIPLMFRAVKPGIGYFEIGVQYSIVRSASHENNLFPYLANNGITTEDWASANLAPVVGFGADIGLISHYLILNIGLRGSMGVFDMKGTDGLGVDLSDPSTYPDYQRTNAASVGLVLGLSTRL